MNRNIELKAVCEDLSAAEVMAKKLSAEFAGVEAQCDTSFRTTCGRLKLRHRTLGAGVNAPGAGHWELISYHRPDACAPRASNYTLIRVADGPELLELLGEGLGVLIEVRKRRRVYLHDRVRIHLDEVEELGSFLEFEALVGSTCDDASARVKLDRLIGQFEILPEQLVDVSYSDLLLSASNSSMMDSNLSRS